MRMMVYLLYIIAIVLIALMVMYVLFRHLVLETSITVPYSKEQVWAVFNDPFFVAKWDRSVQEVIPISTDPIGVGYRIETIAPKRPGQDEGLRMSYRIIEYQPYRVAILLEQSDMFHNAKWITQVDDAPQGSLITQTMDAEVRLKYFYLVPILLFNRQALVTDMEYMRAALDKEISK
jgi:hypothetical protein